MLESSWPSTHSPPSWRVTVLFDSGPESRNAAPNLSEPSSSFRRTSKKHVLNELRQKYWILKGRVKDETLLTFMAEVDLLMNGRPLIHVSTGYYDEALTPNHFLLGRRNPNLPPDVVSDKDLCSRRRWKHTQVITQHFWKRWVREYLPTLTSVKETLPSSSTRSFPVGVGR